MARLAIDSEDELPELSSVFRAQETKMAKATARIPMKVMANGGIAGAAEEKEKEELQKTKSRRRVLKSVSDNPLLRPLGKEGMRDKGKVRAVSSALLAIPRSVAVLESGGLERMREPERAKELETYEEVAVPARRPPKTAKVLPTKEVEISSDEEEGAREAERRKIRMARPTVRARAGVFGDEEEEESCSENESDGISDFIANDDSSVDEDEDEEEEEEEEEVFPVPKSVRKLVRGRRPEKSEQTDVKISQQVQALLLDWSDDDAVEEKRQASPPVTRRLFPNTTEQDDSTDLGEEFPILSFDPASDRAARRPFKEARPTTPPPSPKKTNRGLVSPKKLPRIPATPHRQSADDFWKPDVVNDWNDEFSPQKRLKPLNIKPGLQDLQDPLDIDKTTGSPKKSPVKKDKALVEARKRFNENKHAIAESFLQELDKAITDGKISLLSAGTGGVKIIWSKKLNTTAGRANWRREAIRPRLALSSSSGGITYHHHASIELAEKVIDDEDRLLNVVAHEFCHLANFMVSEVLNNPHGKEFKVWASKCSAAFGRRGIEVTTKHSYEIAFKYVWTCSARTCGVEYKRHSKSIDPKRHKCGACKAELVQTKPVPRAGTERGDGKKVMGEYQAFVKEHMGKVREDNRGSPQKEIMTLVGKRYQEFKATRLRDQVRVGTGLDGVTEEMDPVDAIVRKIDFLDLTSP